MPPNIYAFNSPYAIAANAYYNSNVRKPGPYDINPFTGQPFTQPRQFSPLEIQAMQQFHIDPASLATPQGQSDFADAVAMVQQQNAQAIAARFAPVIPESRLDVANAARQNAARQATNPATTRDATSVVRQNDPNMPFVTFIASDPRGTSSYQMTDADKQVLAQALSALPTNTAKSTYSNLAAANGYNGKGTFTDYVNKLNKTNASLYAPGGILATDPLAGL